MTENKKEQLLAYGLRLLNRREYSRQELKVKFEQWLQRRGLVDSQQNIHRLLNRISEAGWQNDERFAISYVRLGIDKGWGPIKIAAHLQKKGIAAADIKRHCARPQKFWLEQLQTLLSRKYKGIPTDIQNQEKRYRFLLGRGFQADLIRIALKSDFST